MPVTPPFDFWGLVRTRFATIFQELNGVTSRLYRETPDGLDVRRNPVSIFDGAYSLEFRGYPRIGMEVNTQQEVDVNVRVNLAFLMNMMERIKAGEVVNDKAEYNTAVNDVLKIINAAMTSGEFEEVAFIGTTPIEFQEENQNFGVIGIDLMLSTTVTP